MKQSTKQIVCLYIPEGNCFSSFLFLYQWNCNCVIIICAFGVVLVIGHEPINKLRLWKPEARPPRPYYFQNL